MKRYNSVYDGVYTKPNEMVEESNGDWVRWEDVEAQCAELEAKCAELETKCAELLQAATNVVEWWGSGAEINLSAYTLIACLRNAITKAKGEQP